MYIIGIDPGTHTGLCIFRYEDQSLKTLTLGPEVHHDKLYQLLSKYETQAIVCERFTYQRRDKVVLDSVEYIGVAKLYCQNNKIDLYMQTPAAAKNLWTDEKIKRLGLWLPGKAHEMDALRHVLYFLTNVEKNYSWVEQARAESSSS